MRYRDTGFTEGVQYSLVNNVWGIHYSRGYVNHCDRASNQKVSFVADHTFLHRATHVSLVGRYKSFALASWLSSCRLFPVPRSGKERAGQLPAAATVVHGKEKWGVSEWHSGWVFHS